MSRRALFLPELDTPALVIDLDVLDRNIRAMQAFFSAKPARLRPHFKTHKCPPIAHKQLAAGATGITCATVGEAEVLVQAGVKDILIANEVVGETKISRLMGLIRHAALTVAVDDPANVRDLSAAAVAVRGKLGVLVEVDIGMGRCGVRPGRPAVDLARLVQKSKNLDFRGLQGYEGHLVSKEPGPSKDALVRDALSHLRATKRALESAGIPCREVSGGGTGTYKVTGAHPVMTEIQAGSYATMDATYARITPEFATALFCIVGIVSRPKKGVAIGNAGLKSLTTEFGMPQVADAPGAVVERLAEEHTIIKLRGASEKLRPGDRILVVPSHGCTTFNLYTCVYGIRRGRVECSWQIAARGKSQ